MNHSAARWLPGKEEQLVPRRRVTALCVPLYMRLVAVVVVLVTVLPRYLHSPAKMMRVLTDSILTVLYLLRKKMFILFVTVQ